MDLYFKPTPLQRIKQLARSIRLSSGMLIHDPGKLSPRSRFLTEAPSIYRRLLFKKYCSCQTDSKLDSIFLNSSCPNSALNELREKGIAKIQLDNIDELVNLKDSVDLDQQKIVPHDHEAVLGLYKKSGLIELISAYYGRQALIREEASIIKSSMEKFNKKSPPSKIYHSDTYRQVSIMILLEDLGSDSVHMEYCLKSHIYQQPHYDRKYIDQNKVQHIYEIFQAIGPAGTCYIFDTEGLHKGVYKEDFGKRVMFHQNFHPGLYSAVAKRDSSFLSIINSNHDPYLKALGG